MKLRILVAFLVLASCGIAHGAFNTFLLNKPGGGTGSGALIFSQYWDTSGSLPSGWTFNGSPTIDTSGNHSVTSNNAFTAPNNIAAGQSQLYNTADNVSGNVTVSSKFLFTSTSGNSSARVVCRNTGSLVSYYGAMIVNSGSIGVGGTGVSFQLFKTVSTSTQTILGSAVTPSGGSFATSVWYRVFLECSGSTIGAKLRRENDGWWLNSSGSFQSTEAYAVQATDTTITGAGNFGMVTRADTAGTTIYADDFEVYQNNSYPAAQSLIITPSTSNLLTGYANHRGYPVSIFANGSLASQVTVNLSDGGIGGRFYLGSQSFQPITSVTLASSSILSNTTVFYCPPYNRSSSVTLTASTTPFGNQTVTAGITAYPTTGTPTVANINWDAVAETFLFTGSNLGGPGFFASALPFQAQGGITSLTGYTNLINSGNAPSLSGGNFLVNGGQQWYRLNTAVPHTQYQVELQVNSWGGGATDVIDVGIAIDANNYFAIEVDNNAGTIKIFQNSGGTRTQLGSTTTATLPAGTKISISPRVPFPANSSIRLDMQYLTPGSSAYTTLAAVSTNSVNWCLFTVFQNYFPFFGVNESSGSTINVTNFTAGYRQAAPVNNTSVIWSVDQGGGNPLLASDGSIYLAANFHSETPIFKLNPQTWALTQVATMFGSNGTCEEGVGVDQVAYVPSSDSFVVTGDDDGLTAGVSAAQEYAGTISTDVVAPGTVTGVTLTVMKLPNTVAGGTSPGFYSQNSTLSFNGSTWTIFFSQSSCSGASPCAFAAVLATSSGSSLTTSTWTQTYKTTAGGGITDGCTIVQVGTNSYGMFGGQYATYFTTLSTGAGQTALTTVTLDNRGATNQNFGYNTQTSASWPLVAPIPGETAGQTRYIFPVWNQLGSGTTQSLVFYEAITRYTSAQFTWHTKN